MKVKIGLALLMLCICNACKKNDVSVNDNSLVSVHAVVDKKQDVNAISRAATDSETKTYVSFEENDCIGLFAFGGLKHNTDPLSAVNNIPFTLTSDKWINDKGLKWDTDFGTPGDIYAYYPYQADLSSGYTIYNNVKSQLNDILVAERITVENNNPAIFLTFKHRFALLRIKLGTGFDGFEGEVSALTDRGVDGVATVNNGVIQLNSGTIQEFKPVHAEKGYSYIVVPAGKIDGTGEDVSLEYIKVDGLNETILPVISPEPNNVYNMTLHKGVGGTIRIIVGDIERWSDSKYIGTIKGTPGLYWASELVNLGKLYNQNSGQDNTALADYGKWIDPDGDTPGHWEFYLQRNLYMSDLGTDQKCLFENFKDVFSGRGHTIYGLEINGDKDNTGIFGKLETGAVVENLKITDASVKGPGSNTGILAGYAQEGVTIKNCSIDGTAVVEGNGNTGGLLGSGKADISRSSVSVNIVNGTGANAGGLIGALLSSGKVDDCYALGKVDSNGDNVGGLIGMSEGKVSNSHAACDVAGRDYTAGLIGKSDSEITNCFANGAIKGEGNVGGLIGYTTGEISYCGANGSVEGNATVGGLIGYTNTNVEKSYSRASVTGVSSVGGLIGVAEAYIEAIEEDLEQGQTAVPASGTYVKNCYATNQLQLIGNATGYIGASYDISSGAGDAVEHYYCVDISTMTTAQVQQLVDDLNTGQSNVWVKSMVIVGGRAYEVPVLTHNK